MKFVVDYYWVVVCFLLFTTRASASEPVVRKHVFSVHAGYANMLSGTSGLTNSSSGYEEDLSSGVSWDAQYYFNLKKYVGFGLLYSGYSSKGSLPNSSDHVHTHYIAPQFGFYCLRNDRLSLRLNAGTGYLAYRNNGTVYEKERRVSGGRWAINVGGNIDYALSEHWGVSADIQYMYTELYKVTAHYHGEDITVRYPSGKELDVARLNISAGISYYF